MSHSHDHGFKHDLPKLLGRRRFLSFMGGLGLASASGLPAAALECIALPWETQGPYPADGSNVKDGQTVNALLQEGILREDIRASFGDYEGSVEGVPLELELTLQNADGCTPLEGYAIYIWHCDGEGKYSLYDHTEANWLRGLAIADAEGKVKFTTIVPGCYPSRWPHIHFEVFESVEAAVSGENSVLTAQIAIPEDQARLVYEDENYTGSTANLDANSISGDNVFGDNTDDEIAQQTLAMEGTPADGYAGSVVIPIDFDAERVVDTPPSMPGEMGPGGMDGEMPPMPPQD
ncbi:dioxygenase family protein [Celeribacter sp. ULVN23_4]